MNNHLIRRNRRDLNRHLRVVRQRRRPKTIHSGILKTTARNASNQTTANNTLVRRAKRRLHAQKTRRTITVIRRVRRLVPKGDTRRTATIPRLWHHGRINRLTLRRTNPDCIRARETIDGLTRSDRNASGNIITLSEPRLARHHGNRKNIHLLLLPSVRATLIRRIKGRTYDQIVKVRRLRRHQPRTNTRLHSLRSHL